MIRQPFKARTSEELVALLGAVATAVLAVIIIATLYFGREILIPIAMAILLSFVLAPLVGLLQRIRVPRAIAVVERGYPCVRADLRDGKSACLPTDATRRRSAAISIHHKRENPVISRHHGRPGNT